MFPDELEVVITSSHLTHGVRDDITRSPLALAVKEMFPDNRIIFTLDYIRIFDGNWLLARYHVSDDAWKLVARHSAGRSVKPGIFLLPAIYRRAGD